MIDKGKIRRFGIVAFSFFGTLSLLGVWTEKPVPTFFFGCLGLLGLAFIVIPGPSAPVYEGWLKVSHIIGRLITACFLILAYYLVMTPSALIKKLFGGAPLLLKPDKNAVTYWVARNETAQPKERFLKRY